MKRIKAIAFLSAAMLTLMPVTTFAQKKGGTTSDYSLQKVCFGTITIDNINLLIKH